MNPRQLLKEMLSEIADALARCTPDPEDAQVTAYLKREKSRLDDILNSENGPVVWWEGLTDETRESLCGYF